jgi:hypothetical protein
MNPQQLADSVIAEENLDNTNSATEEPTPPADDPANPPSADPTPTNDPQGGDEPATPPTDPAADPKPEEPAGEPNPADPSGTPTTEPTTAPEIEGKTASETVAEARSLLSTLELTEDKVFTETGDVRPFEEIYPAGAFLASQLEPVKVTDKDGNVHEFLLLDDVKTKFPDGFEAKNNIEQMEFQQAILGNETKFKEAVSTYQKAAEAYTQETNAIVQSRSDNARLRDEYNSMANKGLVPKVEGDPNDPKFLEQPAVKELDKILQWKDQKNKELAKDGLGQITSLYVAKQLMDAEGVKVDTSKAKEDIINERKEVASLSNSGTPSKDEPKQVSSNVPLSRLADEIIAQEGLK